MDLQLEESCDLKVIHIPPTSCTSRLSADGFQRVEAEIITLCNFRILKDYKKVRQVGNFYLLLLVVFGIQF